MDWKYEWIIENAIMYEFEERELPSKKKVYTTHLKKKLEDLATMKNFTKEVITSNQVEDVTLK